MNTTTSSTRRNTLRAAPPLALRIGLPIACAIAAFAAMGTRAGAAELDQITVAAPVVKTVGRDSDTNAPIDRVTVAATVATDPETLTFPSGVVLFKDYVSEAAHKACAAADPSRPVDQACIRNAIAAAKPQVNAAIADAKSRANG